MVEAECEENPAQWKWQETHRAGNQDTKNKLNRKLTWKKKEGSRGSVSNAEDLQLK